jgi:hypothetical protein
MKLYTNFDNFINEAKVMKQKDTAKIAQKLASALSKADGKEFTISKDSLDAGGWDLDMDGEEFAGGTYFIGDAGEIVNAATSNDVYGHMDDSEAELVKKIKKGKFAKYRATESVVNEASLSGVEFGNDDDIHPTKFKPLTTSLKKNKVKMEVEKEEGYHGYPEVKLTGKRKDIEKVLADVWGPDSISDYEDYFESKVNEARFKKGQYIKATADSDDFDGDVYDVTNDVDGSTIYKDSSFEIYGINRNEVILWSDEDEVEYSIDPDDLKHFVKESLDIELNEALKSSKLRNLIDIRQGGKQLMQGIYGLAKVALDKVTDDMVITNSNPVEVYKKAKTYGNVLVFWISRNEKENPYTPRNSYGGKDIIPGNTLLAVSNGKNEMFDNHAAYTREYVDGKQRSKTTRSLKNRGRYPGSKDTVGVDKSHSTWSGTGLGNIKRIAEVSDECYIINLDAVRDRLSTSNKVSQRFSQKADATAFDNPKDIKQANITKYQSILAQRADNPDKIDKQVKEIIEDAHQFLMAGLAKKEMGDYNELSIGKDPKGRDIKPRDLTNYISNILSDYQGYVSAYVNAKTEEEKYGTSSDWYKRDAKRKALELKQRMAKWDNKNIVW